MSLSSSPVSCAARPPPAPRRRKSSARADQLAPVAGDALQLRLLIWCPGPRPRRRLTSARMSPWTFCLCTSAFTSELAAVLATGSSACRLPWCAPRDGTPVRPAPPGWLFNIAAKPDVEVQIGRKQLAGRARIVTPDDPDYPRLWDAVNANNHG